MRQSENLEAVATDGIAPSGTVTIPISSRLTESVAAPKVPKKSMKRLTAEGFIWTIAGYGTGMVVRFGANLILTRLLFPEAFGLMALVNVVLQGLQMFSDIGIAPAIMNHRRGDDPEFYNTAWTMQILRGLALSLVGCVLAVPVSMVYGEPLLAKLVPVMAITALISGFNSTKLFAENRHMRLGRLTCIDLFAQVAGTSLMIGLVWYWHSVWPLVFGALFSVSLKMLLSHFALPGRNNWFCWHRGASRELYRFGRWIFVSSIFTFLAMQTDRLLLGNLIPLKMLGVYSIALGLVSIVVGVFEQFTNRILMPAMSHWLRLSKLQFKVAVLRSRQFILTVAAVAVSDMILLAPLLIETLYDSRYHAAGWITQLLGIGLWFTLLQRTSQASLLAAGHSRGLAAANSVNFFVTVIAAPLGFYLWELPGFILGWTLGNLAAVIVIDHEMAKDGIPLRFQDLSLSAGLAALCIAGFGLQTLLVQYVMPPQWDWVGKVLPPLVMTAVVGVVALVWARQALAKYSRVFGRLERSRQRRSIASDEGAAALIANEEAAAFNDLNGD